MIVNQTPYPISFEREISQALTCRYGEEMRQYIFKPDINVSGLSCLLQIAKPDGTFTENGVEVRTDPDTGECTLVLTIPTQATVVKGLAQYSICCYGEVETETHLLYSAEGPLWVDDDLITEEMIQSVAEVNGMVFPQDFLTVDMIPEIVAQVAAQVLPEVLPAERGFYLRASQDTGEPEWSPVDMPIPGYGPSDAGKSLTVNSDGTNIEWKNLQHVYSTQEHIVGKWIDGNTLYERTITGTADYDVTGLNVVEMFGVGQTTSGAVVSFPYFYNSDTLLVWIGLYGGASLLKHSTNYTLSALYRTIRYTKTS